MRTVIFKSEKKAKVYELRSAVKQGVYSEGEFIGKVKTDNIDKLNQDAQYRIIAKEVA
jgi:hypothetical protein